MKKSLFILVLVVITTVGFSQLDMSAEIRPRAEFRRGYASLPTEGVDPAVFISQRTRLNFYYKKDKLSIGVSFHDIRVWGDETLQTATGVFGNDASIDLNEGWVQLVAGNDHTFKLGRQFLVYQDDRLLSARNWNQHAAKYDAFLYKFSRSNYNVHLCLSFNNQSENIYGNDYNLFEEILRFDTVTNSIIKELSPLRPRIRTLNFLYFAKTIGRSDYSVIAMATGLQNPLSTNLIYLKGTYGLYYKYTGDPLSIRSTVYYQNGKHFNGNPVSAYMFHTRADYKINRFMISAGIDYLSGHDALNNDEQYQSTQHLFDILYGNRHGLYGHMDYFSNMPVATSNGGLADIYTGINYTFSEAVSVYAAYHYFRLQNRVADPEYKSLALDKSLASELDLGFKIKFLPEVFLDGGFSFMLPTESLEKIQKIAPGESKFAYWGWLMLTAKPNLYKG